MALPLRVGVVGCGLIAQVMHLPHLAELTDDYEIAALCDVSEPVAAALPSPYLRNVLSLLTIETGQDGTPFAARTVEVVSYQEAFKPARWAPSCLSNSAAGTGSAPGDAIERYS